MVVEEELIEVAIEVNFDEGDDMVLENKYKIKMKCENSGKYPGGEDIGGEGWIGGD